MELFEAFERRHSYRSFKRDPVPREVLERLVYAASLAPSSHNEQPWRFFVATGATRQRIAEAMVQGTHYLEEYVQLTGGQVTDPLLRWYTELGDAPVLLVCAMPQTDDVFRALNIDYAVGGALEHVLLAATEEGLGSCLVTFAFWVRDEICRLVGAPKGWVCGAMVALGYPSEEVPEPSTRERDIATYLE